MYEPLTALELEQKSAKLLEILQRKAFAREDSIKYLAAVLLEYYDKGYNDSIIVLGKLK